MSEPKETEDPKPRSRLCLILPWIIVIVLLGYHLLDKVHFHTGGEKWFFTYNEEPIEAANEEAAYASLPDPGIPLRGGAKSAEKHSKRVKSLPQTTSPIPDEKPSIP